MSLLECKKCVWREILLKAGDSLKLALCDYVRYFPHFMILLALTQTSTLSATASASSPSPSATRFSRTVS